MRETEFVGHNLSRAKLPRIRVGGVALEYREIPGEASDATELVFLHSALGSARLWEDFPDQIADATGCSALIYSRRGHGNSDPLPAVHDGGYLDHEALSVLPAMLRARGVDRPVLIGHSDGATIALIAAAQESIEARALVLIAPHVIVEDISVEGIRETVTLFEREGLRAKLAKHQADVDGIFHRWADVWQRPEFRRWTIVPLLPDVMCPTLVIQGEDDRFGSLEQVDLIEANVSGPVERMVLDDCGHAPQVDHPDTVIDQIVEFVRRL